jgi:hypothetical protein
LKKVTDASLPHTASRTIHSYRRSPLPLLFLILSAIDWNARNSDSTFSEK